MTTLAIPDDKPGDVATSTDRRTWLLATGVVGGTLAAGAAVPFVSSFTPSERALAAGAAVEVDVSDLAPGELRTVEWRGKPVWVMRRTPEMMAALEGQDAALADPASTRDDLPEALRNPGRSLRPEILVAVGICTHLGCSPSSMPAGTINPSVGDDWQGGFFCPCHGSTFDLAGRVFKNKPAPTNLEIPPHRYVGATKIVIGESGAA